MELEALNKKTMYFFIKEMRENTERMDKFNKLVDSLFDDDGTIRILGFNNATSTEELLLAQLQNGEITFSEFFAAINQ